MSRNGFLKNKRQTRLYYPRRLARCVFKKSKILTPHIGTIRALFGITAEGFPTFFDLCILSLVLLIMVLLFYVRSDCGGF
jgi:hypothetical protein